MAGSLAIVACPALPSNLQEAPFLESHPPSTNASTSTIEAHPLCKKKHREKGKKNNVDESGTRTHATFVTST